MPRRTAKIGTDASTQLSLFDADLSNVCRLMVSPQVMEPGSLDFGQRLREMMSAALKSCEKSRYEVAARMSELAGVEITKSQLDCWTAESKEGYRFPAEYLPAFCHATGNRDMLRLMAELSQCRLIENREAVLMELGRIEHAKRQLSEREKNVRQFLKQTERV